jgi:hypothetical protein
MEAKMKIKKILSKCNKEGMHARNETPEKQAVIQANVKEWLQAIQETWLKTWRELRSYFAKKRGEIQERLKLISRGIPCEMHKEQFRYGLIYFSVLLLTVFAEFWLLIWTLHPYGFGLEVFLISAVILAAGMLSVHFFLSKLKESHPKLYNKIKLGLALISVVAILIASIALAKVRGELLVTSRSVQEGGEVIAKAENFYGLTSLVVTGSLALIGISLSLVAGLVLHEALPRLIISGNVLRNHKKLAKYERNIVHATNQIEAGRQIVKLGMVEFKRGMYSHSGRGSWITSLCFLILFLGPFLTSSASASERNILFIICDQSRSTLCETSKMSQFQKNLNAVAEIFKQAKPGSRIKLIGITDSFGNTSVLLDRSLPEDPGTFGEKLLMAKQALTKDLNELCLAPEFGETDVFGCLFHVSAAIKQENGTKSLIILSDMRNSIGLNLETVPVIGEGELQRTESLGLIPDLSGVRVYALGVSPCGRDLKYWKSLERFWRAYFEKAGARLECFSMERDWKPNGQKGD